MDIKPRQYVTKLIAISSLEFWHLRSNSAVFLFYLVHAFFDLTLPLHIHPHSFVNLLLQCSKLSHHFINNRNTVKMLSIINSFLILYFHLSIFVKFICHPIWNLILSRGIPNRHYTPHHPTTFTNTTLHILFKSTVIFLKGSSMITIIFIITHHHLATLPKAVF